MNPDDKLFLHAVLAPLFLIHQPIKFRGLAFQIITRSDIVRVMRKGKRTASRHDLIATDNKTSGRRHSPISLYGASVEYCLHVLLWLLSDYPRRASSRDLADMQGVPPAMLAKIMPKLEKAGIVSSSGGIAGGYELARPPSDITVLDVVDAVERDRRLFDCKEVRRDCVLFGGRPPAWSVAGVCRIHAVMLRAEKLMRTELDSTTLADLVKGGRPPEFEARVADWFRNRSEAREATRVAAVKKGRRQKCQP